MKEHDSLGPDVDERARPRPLDPAAEAASHEVSSTDQAALGGRAPLRASAVIGLQRAAGNAAVAGLLQRRVATEEQEAEGQRQASPVLDVVGKGGGQPLQPELKGEMESRLGDDFSDVRIHTDPAAAQSAAAVSAKAYTVGNEVVFGADSPALDSAQGKRTLAHELTHVIQQRSGPVEGTPTGDGIAVSHPSDRFEQAAEANAERVTSDGAVDAAPVQREVAELDEDELTDEDEPVQGAWVQRAPATTDNAAEDEEEEEYWEEEDDDVATGDDFDDEKPVQGAWVQRAPTAPAPTAPAATYTTREEKDKKKADAANLVEELGAVTVHSAWGEEVGRGTARREGEEKVVVKDFTMADNAQDLSDAYPFSVVKGDMKGFGNLAFKGSSKGTVRFNAENAAPVDLSGPTVEDFDRDFKPETIISELTRAGGENHARVGAHRATAPAPASGGSSESTTSGVTAGDSESEGKVLAALAKVNEFKEALDKVKQAVKTDWTQVVAGRAAVTNVPIAFPAGFRGDLDENLITLLNDRKIDIKVGDTHGLSVELKTEGDIKPTSAFIYDVYELYPLLRKAQTGAPTSGAPTSGAPTSGAPTSGAPAAGAAT